MSAARLSLYRSVLKAVRVFPSRYRESLLRDVKLEWREPVRDAADLARRVALAEDGLKRLRLYSGLDKTKADWDVSLAGPST